MQLAAGNAATVANAGIVNYHLGQVFANPFLPTNPYWADLMKNAEAHEAYAADMQFGAGGDEAAAPHDRYVKDAEGKYIWGGHPDMSTDEWSDFQAMVKAHQSAFAYSMQDLTGYNGVAGPYTIKLKDGVHSVFRPTRRYSAVETQVLMEKVAD